MSKKGNVYFVLTEEGMCTMASSPLEALEQYLATNGDDIGWLNEVLSGESEIECIVEMTRDEYREWLKTAKEV